ncbi:MAG: nicotinamide riboside transporter PnuC [Parashewanella sp.]
MELLQTILGEATALTGWEALSVVLALAYLILAMKQSIWCWPAAFISSAIYVVIFWQVSLLMEAVLSAYYVAMAIYGYWMWTKGSQDSSGNSIGVKVTSWSATAHVKIIVAMTILSLGIGYFMATNTSASFPYLDAATTCFAIMTTYLVAKKVLENWIYWIFINSVSIYLYSSKGLMLTSTLFVLYVILAFIGYAQWRKNLTHAQQV